MNIRDLKYLVAVAEHNHFGKAAEASFVSQPALSMQIKKLEEELGIILIERTNKRILFTDIGKLIVQQARDILYHVNNLQEIANQAKDPFRGDLHLGIIPTLGQYLLPLIIPKLSTLFPQLNLYLVEDTTLNLLTKLTEGKIDAALLALPIEGDFVSNFLFAEEFVLAVPLGHPLAERKIINFADLDNKTLLLLEDGHCLRDQALAVCHKAANTSEFKNFRATSLETLRHMVTAGVGITLMPKLSCRADDGIAYLSFASPVPTRSIGIIWRESAAKQILLEQLVNHIKTVLRHSQKC